MGEAISRPCRDSNTGTVLTVASRYTDWAIPVTVVEYIPYILRNPDVHYVITKSHHVSIWSHITLPYQTVPLTFMHHASYI